MLSNFPDCLHIHNTVVEGRVVSRVTRSLNTHNALIGQGNEVDEHSLFPFDVADLTIGG